MEAAFAEYDEDAACRCATAGTTAATCRMNSQDARVSATQKFLLFYFFLLYFLIFDLGSMYLKIYNLWILISISSHFS